MEILQLWLNLPARLKMTAPRYIGLQKSDIPSSVRRRACD
jgi:redox-sensitive bicupin YhaK (pirin superfamily)